MKKVKLLVFLLLLIVPTYFVYSDTIQNNSTSFNVLPKLKISTLFNGKDKLNIKDKNSITVTLLVENTTNEDSHNNIVTSIIPSGFNVISVNSKDGYKIDGNTISWNIDNIKAMSKLSLSFNLAIPKNRNINDKFYINSNAYSDNSVPVTASSLVEVNKTAFIETKDFKTGVLIIVISLCFTGLLIVGRKQSFNEF